MAEAAPQGDGTTHTPEPERRRAIALRPLWIAGVVLLSLATAAAGAYLLTREPPVVERALPAPPAEGPSPEAVRRAGALRALNGALENQIGDLKQQIEKPQCPPGTVLDPAAAGGKAALDAITPPAPGPVGDGGKAAQDTPPGPTDQAAITPPPVLDDARGALKPLSSAQLAKTLDQATALVLTQNSTATGFFVSDRLLVTNRHAVEGAERGQVFLASSSLGQVRVGQVVAASPQGQPGSADFALVRLQDSRAPGTLPLTGTVSKLMNVVAAGYPGFSIEKDAGFQRLINGDATAAPDLNVTSGTVQSIQKTPQGLTAIVHEASVLKGNSGGPLVDRCGRVVGINTFIAVDQTQSARNNYALATSDLAAFLKTAKSPVALDSRPCAAG